ncbi:hypothetical protein [Pseudofulvibacter geojedonensis]|uniref:Lipocalin-like domain-containing protein n=1 Tax=Pseudofulvibacter geojedonensis TaxID=1123758 RepID=A0ABW3I046_9FLAO
MKNILGTLLFAITIMLFLFKNCSSDSESKYIQVKDWNSEASVREGMQGKWYTAQDQIASSAYYVTNGTGWERRLLIEGNTVTAWSRSNINPEWKRIGSGELRLVKHETNALSEVSANHRAIKWIFEVDYDNSGFETLTVKYEKNSGGVKSFRKGDYDIYRGWNH